MARSKTDKKSKTTRPRSRDPEAGEFRPGKQAHDKRKTPSDEVENVIPADGKLGRSHN